MHFGVGRPWSKKWGISVIYLSLTLPMDKSSYMTTWEADFQYQWDLETWQAACAKSFKGILNISLIEASLKVLTRLYLTPTRLVSIYPSADPLCFRGCQLIGSMVHIWWECHRIHSFWNKIFNLISKVTKCTVPRSPSVALLNVHMPQISKCKQQLIHFILLGAKLTIARDLETAKYYHNYPISWIMSQEKLASILADTAQKCENTWEPWALFVGVSLTPGILPSQHSSTA